MSRKKRTSRALEKAELRTSGLKAIDPTMDFGENRNLQNIAIASSVRTSVDEKT